MARKISKKAVLASLRSSKTPKNLKSGLRKYAKKERGELSEKISNSYDNTK